MSPKTKALLKVAMVAALCLTVLTGCAVVEYLFGIKTDAKTGEKTSDGSGGVAGGLLSMVAPWATALVASGAGVYANVKRAGWKAAAVSTAASIEEWKANHPNQWGALKEVLKDKHERAKVQAYIKALTKK